MVKKTGTFDLTMAKKAIELAKIVKTEPKTGDRYFDVHLTHESQLIGEIVTMSVDKFRDLCYEFDATLNEKANDPDLDLSKMHPPLINIYTKCSQGKGRATVAKAQGLKDVPVLVFAKKKVHIDTWKAKNSIK